MMDEVPRWVMMIRERDKIIIFTEKNFFIFEVILNSFTFTATFIVEVSDEIFKRKNLNRAKQLL